MSTASLLTLGDACRDDRDQAGPMFDEENKPLTTEHLLQHAVHNMDSTLTTARCVIRAVNATVARLVLDAKGAMVRGYVHTVERCSDPWHQPHYTAAAMHLLDLLTTLKMTTRYCDCEGDESLCGRSNCRNFTPSQRLAQLTETMPAAVLAYRKRQHGLTNTGAAAAVIPTMERKRRIPEQPVSAPASAPVAVARVAIGQRIKRLRRTCSINDVLNQTVHARKCFSEVIAYI
jgi:hypothetical protein